MIASKRNWYPAFLCVIANHFGHLLGDHADQSWFLEHSDVRILFRRERSELLRSFVMHLPAKGSELSWQTGIYEIDRASVDT